MRPLIGITAHTRRQPGGLALEVSAAYAEAVQAAGGTPVILPVYLTGYDRGVMDRLDGVLLTGGGRLLREAFEDAAGPSLERINPERYAFERALVADAVERDLPILGICRGMQMLTEVLGGSLIADIAQVVPRALTHYQRRPAWQPTHDVQVESNSRLAEVAGASLIHVNSFHRQAVDVTGNLLRVTGRAPDGVVEAVEGNTFRFVMGVQFHPERLLPRTPAWRGLFQAFVDATHR